MVTIRTAETFTYYIPKDNLPFMMFMLSTTVKLILLIYPDKKGRLQKIEDKKGRLPRFFSSSN